VKKSKKGQVVFDWSVCRIYGMQKIGNATDGRMASAVGKHPDKGEAKAFSTRPLVGRSFRVFPKKKKRERDKKWNITKQGRGRRRLVDAHYLIFISFLLF
jgi:hypothetical protein